MTANKTTFDSTSLYPLIQGNIENSCQQISKVKFISDLTSYLPFMYSLGESCETTLAALPLLYSKATDSYFYYTSSHEKIPQYI